jgi:hypothetical protein
MLSQDKIDELDLKSKMAAHTIVNALKVFKNEPIQVQQQAFQVVMARVQRVLNGERDLIDDPALTRVIEEPEGEPAPAQESEENSN